MQQRNIDFLNQYQGVYDFYKITGELRQIDQLTRETFLNIAREEFFPGYLCCLHCNGDVIALVKYVYIQYGKYKESAKVSIETVAEPVLQTKKKKK